VQKLRYAPRLAVFAMGFISCVAGRSGIADPPTPSVPVWQYDVTATTGGRELSVVATFPPGSDSELSMVEGADAFVSGVEHEGVRGWIAAKHAAGSFLVPECRHGCTIRYRYRLEDAARTWGDVATARDDGDAIESPPSTWLLRPTRAVAATRMRFRVVTGPGDSFVSGVFAADTPGTFEAGVGEYMQLPYSAFGRLRLHELADGGATVAILPGVVPEEDLLKWAEEALLSVRGFYGRLPLRHVLIIVRPTGDEGVGFGSTMGYSGGAIAINVGGKTTRAGFRDDWVLVHELVHTALPDLARSQHWLEEGLATYVEPLARARRGVLTPAEVWGEWAKSMSQGEPGPGDLGLDHTHTWGRTYWGGALFCLVADVQIRQTTRGKASLEDALRAIVNADGNIAVSWPVERVLSVGDAATGTKVLSGLYAKMSASASPVDLDALWRQLGVSLGRGGAVHLDDSAELAWVRNAMTPPR
jgi:hypothetical protein